MKLYTINATPVRCDVSETENNTRVGYYSSFVAKTLSTHGIDGFTISKQNGYWQGEPEVSFKIEVATDKKQTIVEIATSLRDSYNQDSVMVTMPDNTVEFI